MTLLGLRRALEQTEPGSEERKRLEEEIERLEKLMDM